MATELATGYISLSIRYADAMKQINRDFTNVATTAQKSGSKAGQAFSQGMQSQTRNISQNVGFGQVAGKATQAGRQAGGAFSTGFLTGTKGLSTKVSQSVQQVASPKQMQSSGSTAGAGFMAGLAGGMLKGGAVGLVTTAIAGIGTAVTLGMGRLTSIDDANAKLLGLGHSAETVKTIMDNALTAVKGTAFGLGDAASAAATAVAAGVQPGEQLTKRLKGIADAAAIAGVPLGDMAAIFNKVQTNGVAMTDDLQQIADRGIPIFTKLAEHFGVTGTELKKMVEDGKIDAASFATVMDKTVGGAAQKMGTSVSGGFANLKAAIGRFGAGLLEPLFKQLPGLFAKLTPMMDNLTKTLGPAFASIGAQIGPALTQLGQLFNTHLLPAIKEVWANIKGPLAEAFATAKAAFIEALPVFKAVATVIGVALVAGVKAAGVVWPIMINSLTQAMNVFRAFAAVVTGAWDLVSGAFTAGWDIISGVFDKMKAGFTAVKDFISTVFTGVKTAVEAVFKGIVEVIKEPLRAVGRMIQGIPVINLPLGGTIDVTGFGDKLAGLALGGGIGGRGNRDTVPAMLTPGEHVLTTGDVAALGGQGGVYAFRNALHRKRGGDIKLADILGSGDVGPVGPQGKGGRRTPSLGPGANKNQIALPEWGTPGSKFGPPPTDWWLKPLNPDDILFPDWMPPGMRERWLDEWGKNRKKIQGLGFKGGGAVDLMTEAKRIGIEKFNLNPTTYTDASSSFHNTGEAFDFFGSPADMLGFAQYMNSHYKSGIAELIFDAPRWNDNIKDGKDVGAFGEFYTMGQAGYHGDHVHLAVKKGTTAAAAGTSRRSGGIDSLSDDSSEEEIAAAIIGEGRRRGFSDAEIQAIIATALGESGLNPNITNDIGRHGLFQQDEGYPGRFSAGGQISGFFDRLAAGKAGGDIYSRITGVQKGGYGADWIKSNETRAADLMSRVGDLASGADDDYDNADTAVSDMEDTAASSDNPYVRLIEAIKDILPDFGQMADIGVGGLKETFLPPGFSDPTQWGALKMGAGLMGFASGLTNNPTLKGLLGIGSAALGGSGSGVVSAIEGMIPTPFGSATPVAVGPTAGQPTPFGALGAPPGPPAIGSQLGVGPAVDNSIHIGQVNDDANKVLDKTARQQAAAQRIHLGTRRFV